MKKSDTYEVTLRRDVQQVTCIRVQASSRQEAIDVAEAATDEYAWNVEEHIGTHRPKVEILGPVDLFTPAAVIKSRQTGKSDRRDGTDPRSDKRRLGDKSAALVMARTRRSRP